MGRASLIIICLTAIIILSLPQGLAGVTYDSISIEPSQKYIRLGMNDTVTITVKLLDHGKQSNYSNEYISLRLAGDPHYVELDRMLLVTDDNGCASTQLRLSDELVLPQGSKLPLTVQIIASTDHHTAGTDVYITNTADISGYVVDDNSNTILDAMINVYSPDGRPADFLGGPFYSSNGTNGPMGSFAINDIPCNVGMYRLVAQKGNYTGTLYIDPAQKIGQTNIVIPGYHESTTIPTIVPGITSVTTTPEAVAQTESNPKPTSMTNTILIIIILISVVYLGLKVYRKMF